jgi:hypothetical protein
MNLLRHHWSGDFFFGVLQHGMKGPGSVEFQIPLYFITKKQVMPNPVLTVSLNYVQFMVYNTYLVLPQ